MAACLAVAGGVEEKERINGLLKAVSQLSTDTKAVRGVELLQEAFGDGYESAIVFTGYTDTMDYLKEHLAAHFPTRNVGCYAGSGGQRRDLSGQWVSVPKEQIKRDRGWVKLTFWPARMPPAKASTCKPAALWSTMTCRGTR